MQARNGLQCLHFVPFLYGYLKWWESKILEIFQNKIQTGRVGKIGRADKSFKYHSSTIHIKILIQINLVKIFTLI